MFPVRCYTCNSVLAHLYPEFRSHHDVRRLDIDRMCCRRMFLGHTELPLSFDPGHVDFVIKGIRYERKVHGERVVGCE